MEVSITKYESEQVLIDALKEGKLSAFEDFYDQYAPCFYGEVKRTFLTEDISEQTLKQIFKNIWLLIHTYDPSKEHLFTWGIKIARKEIRKQKTELVLREIFYCQQKIQVNKATQDKILL